MQVKSLSIFLLLSTSLLLSTVVCDPNHHHNHNNDFPWQNILSSLGISITEPSGESLSENKEHYTSEPTVEILKSETKDGIETPAIVQNEHYASEATEEIGTSETAEGNETVVTQNVPRIPTIKITTSSNSDGSGLGWKIGIPIAGIVFFVLFWYCVCKCCYICVEACCCGCYEEEKPDVVVMQSNTVQAQQPASAGPQIFLQQPIIHQQAIPMPDSRSNWVQPPPQGHPQWTQPPQGHPQWNQPPQGPPQWAPRPMGQQQQYSPNSGYDNAGFNTETAPPPYNTQKY